MEDLPIAALDVVLGALAFVVGWMGWGGVIFGVPAILAGVYSLKKGRGVLGTICLVLGAIGLAETIAVMGILLPALKPEEGGYALGQPFAVGGWEIVALDVKEAKSVIIEGELYEAREGHEAVAVKLRIENVGEETRRPSDVRGFVLVTSAEETHERVSRFELGGIQLKN